MLRIDGIAVLRKNSPQRELGGKHGRMLVSYSKNGGVGNHVLEEFGRAGLFDHKGHKEHNGFSSSGFESVSCIYRLDTLPESL
jgi:hypothetical protein